jgi:hypothetical protein
VAAQFDVTVVNVNVTNHKGKPKRTVTKGGRRTVSGSQTAGKKAYVVLKKGDSLPFFANIAEEEAKQKVADEKAAKAAAKESPEKKRSRFRRAGKKEKEIKS